MTDAGFVDADTWYASLAGTVVAAGALIRDPAGRALLVKPNYRDYWTVPGGICEAGEPPQVGCAREVLEEIGLPLPPGRLLVIDWQQPHGPSARPIMHFIFDGGVLADGDGIVLQEEELDAFRFTAEVELASYLPPVGLARIAGAARALVQDRTILLQHDVAG